MKTIISSLVIFAIALAVVNAPATSQSGANYEITVTNLTRGQTFTPILVATHRQGVRLFTPGSAASTELAMLAEAGDTGPLTDSLLMNPHVGHVVTTGGTLAPGASVTVEIPSGMGFDYISLASMLVPTNDGFFALNGVEAPGGRRPVMYQSPAFDAGSEANDELCVNIPAGGVCAGEGFNPADGEGYVHIHAGIHGIGDLDPADYDWRNPVARIVILRN